MAGATNAPSGRGSRGSTGADTGSEPAPYLLVNNGKDEDPSTGVGGAPRRSAVRHSTSVPAADRLSGTAPPANSAPGGGAIRRRPHRKQPLFSPVMRWSSSKAAPASPIAIS